MLGNDVIDNVSIAKLGFLVFFCGDKFHYRVKNKNHI